MLQNLNTYYDNTEKAIMANPFGDEIVKRTVNIIVSTIRSYEYCPVAAEIADEIDAAWKALTE